MEQALYELDPDGDVILTLYNPNAPFAVWEELDFWPSTSDYSWEGKNGKKGKKKKKGKRVRRLSNLFIEEPLDVPTEEPLDTPVEELLNTPVEEPLDAPVEEPLDAPVEYPIDGPYEERPTALVEPLEVRLRVSSRHLILASPYFKLVLNGPWKEADLVAGGQRQVRADDWDADAFRILMQIIHGRNRGVPKFITLEVLAKIAVLVDYYKCYEAVEPFLELWLQKLESPSTQCDRRLILWLLISWVFRKAEVFRTVTRVALNQSRGPLPTLGLPIPDIIIETIDRHRRQAIGEIITALHDVLADFRDDQAGCSSSCSSILLGALTKQMHAGGLLNPRPERLRLGHAIAEIKKAARDMQTPEWYMSSYSSAHSCTLKSFIQSKVNDLDQDIKGLKIEDF